MSAEIELQATTNINAPMVEGEIQVAEADGPKDDRPEYKQQISAAINAIELPEVCKFDANYIEAKLYEFDELLGGNVRDMEREKAQNDPFNTEVDSIKELIKEIHQKQKVRDTKKRQGAKKLELSPLHDEIQTLFMRADDQLKECNLIVRAQSESLEEGTQQECEQKEKTCDTLKDGVQKLKEREQASMKIGDKMTADQKIASGFSGFDNETDDGVHARTGEPTAQSKAVVKKFTKEDKKLDKVLEQIDEGMDILLDGIDEIGVNLKDQQNLIHEVDGMVDEHAADLKKVAMKLKKNVKNWRKYSNPCLDIIMIASLVVLVGVLIIVIKACW